LIAARAARRARAHRNEAVLERARPFIHLDIDVTPERLAAFTSASDKEKLATLSVLRERTADSGSNEISLYGVCIAIVIAVALPTAGIGELPEAASSAELATRIVLLAVLGFAIAMLVVVGAREWFQRDRQRELAVVWLGAYETALLSATPRERGGWLARVKRKQGRRFVGQ